MFYGASRLRRGMARALPVLALGLSACAIVPVAESPPEPAPTPAEVYVYPTAGQSEAQTDRDRYECHLWAAKQSQYDPSRVSQNAPEQVKVVTPQPGAATAAGAITGAILGAAISGPRDAAGGAIVGAIAGGTLGAAADSAQQEQVARDQRAYDRRYAADAQRAQSYRRAISACLEGRGYTVK